MQESVIYQSILLEGREAGREEGREAGRQAEVDLILRLLNRLIGSVPVEAQQQVRSLSVSELAALGEALLNFATVEDLENWLQNRS